MKYFFSIINKLLMIMIPLTFLAVSNEEVDEVLYSLDVAVKYLPSEVLFSKENKRDEKTLVESFDTTEEDEVVLVTDTDNTDLESVSVEDEVDNTTDSVVLERQIGKMSGYGPDCVGCSGYLASGKYVGNGDIYYQDATYGNVRIVAGDSKYPFGSIIQVNNSSIGTFLAIVLDRGGAIGLGKSYMFDLLYPSESLALNDGVSYNVTFDVLRYGY